MRTWMFCNKRKNQYRHIEVCKVSGPKETECPDLEKTETGYKCNHVTKKELLLKKRRVKSDPFLVAD